MTNNIVKAWTQAIRQSCHTIAHLWSTANLIANRLANPCTPHTGGHGKYRQPHSPINDTDTIHLTTITTWLIDAATAAGIPRTTAIHQTEHNHQPALAKSIAHKAAALAALPDAHEWVADAQGCAYSIERICRIARRGTRWRAALVWWRPSEIAATLTDLTGHPIRADRVRKVVDDGRVHPVHGKVILGEIASAMRL